MNVNAASHIGAPPDGDSSVPPPERAVILHNDPRFVGMLDDFYSQHPELRLTCRFSCDLNDLAGSLDLNLPSLDDVAPLDEEDAFLSRQEVMADRIFIGLDPHRPLPTIWKALLWALITSRPPRSGSLVCIDVGEMNPEFLTFEESLAELSCLELILWKCPPTSARRMPPGH